jgi:hypothetical protein
MNRALEARLARLEREIGISADETYDELNIRLWDMVRELLARPDATAEMRDQSRQVAERIEADIKAQAAQVASADYATHLAWVRAMWKSATGKDDYVPAVTGAENGMGEYEDWEAPNVMARRAALRARPDIQRLIGAAAEPAEACR